MALISAKGVLLKFECTEMTQNSTRENNTVFVTLKYFYFRWFVALGRLGLVGVLLVGDVVVVVLVVEGAVAKDGLVRLSLDAGPGASCSGLTFGAQTAKMAAMQQTLAAGSLFI